MNTVNEVHPEYLKKMFADKTIKESKQQRKQLKIDWGE